MEWGGGAGGVVGGWGLGAQLCGSKLMYKRDYRNLDLLWSVLCGWVPGPGLYYGDLLHSIVTWAWDTIYTV